MCDKKARSAAGSRGNVLERFFLDAWRHSEAELRLLSRRLSIDRGSCGSLPRAPARRRAWKLLKELRNGRKAPACCRSSLSCGSARRSWRSQRYTHFRASTLSPSLFFFFAKDLGSPPSVLSNTKTASSRCCCARRVEGPLFHFSLILKPCRRRSPRRTPPRGEGAGPRGTLEATTRYVFFSGFF